MGEAGSLSWALVVRDSNAEVWPVHSSSCRGWQCKVRSQLGQGITEIVGPGGRREHAHVCPSQGLNILEFRFTP